MALTEKELEYFRTQLPEGYAVVDLSDVRWASEFAEKYCPKSMKGEKFTWKKTVRAIDEFIKQAKK